MYHFGITKLKNAFNYITCKRFIHITLVVSEDNRLQGSLTQKAVILQITGDIRLKII